MNFKNKIMAILLISLFISCITLPAATADDVDYSIPQAIMNITVESNGLLHIEEELHYSFDSSANGVYRTIPLKDGESIDNLEIETQGAYSEYTIEKEDGKEQIKIYLYTDSKKSEKISAGDDVTVYIIYDFKNITKLYTDTGEVQYKIWGDEWDVNPEKFSANIHFPSKDGVDYWINPYGTNYEEKWNKNTLTISSEDVGDYIELRAIIPLTEFTSEEYARVINKAGLEKINDIQNGYESKATISSFLSNILDIIYVISLAIPAGVYLKFGREPKINYEGIYEREPPTNDSPAFVNSIAINTPGELDLEAFQATILDLINRKFITIDVIETTEFTKESFLKINDDRLSELEDFEIGVINILKAYEINHTISLRAMEESSESMNFANEFNNWCSEFIRNHIPESTLKRYFISDGQLYLKIFGGIEAVIGVLIILIAFFFDFYNIRAFVILGFLMIITATACFFAPATFGGRWSEYGMEYHKKWENFKKYLTDYSLIKEYPPESIAIWNKYLVYAAALGVADEVYKAMKLQVYSENEDYYGNDLYMFFYFGGYDVLDTVFIGSFIDDSLSNFDDFDFGDIGGGSGGGGGGAF